MVPHSQEYLAPQEPPTSTGTPRTCPGWCMAKSRVARSSEGFLGLWCTTRARLGPLLPSAICSEEEAVEMAGHTLDLLFSFSLSSGLMDQKISPLISPSSNFFVSQIISFQDTWSSHQVEKRRRICHTSVVLASCFFVCSWGNTAGEPVQCVWRTWTSSDLLFTHRV